MNHRIASLAALSALVCFVPGTAHAAALPAAEKAKIESLISNVEGLKDAKFVRNGSEYDAATAAKFLRGKWDRKSDEIKTAEDFIAKAATKSDTSGKPYMIRIKGQGDKPCADYLHEQLKKS